MSFQVLVKTTPGMLGSYSYDLGTREAAREFTQRPDVWWWTFPAEEDTLDGGSWHRGGAWSVPVSEAAAALESALTRNGPVPVSGTELPYARQDAKPEEDDDDDRW